MKVLTAEEVRELPLGSTVRIHSVDKYGYPQYIDMKVVQKGKHKEFECFDYLTGQWIRQKIRKMPENDAYRYYELKDMGKGAAYV